MARLINPSKAEIARLRRSFKANKQYAHYSRHVPGAVAIVNALFDTMDRAQKTKLPKGIEVGEVTLRVKGNSKKTLAEMEVASFMMDAVKLALGYEETV